MENGDWRFLTIWGSGTLEPIELKFGMIDYVRHATVHAKIDSCPKGIGVKVVASRSFFLLAS